MAYRNTSLQHEPSPPVSKNVPAPPGAIVSQLCTSEVTVNVIGPDPTTVWAVAGLLIVPT